VEEQNTRPIKIAVLLPTFNGEKYLAEQLDSVLAQGHKDIVVVIRDDGSSDGTREIIRSYRDGFPDKIHVIDGDGTNLGASGSFAFLMRFVLLHKKELGLGKAYMMFCDQDDIWAENKIEIEIDKMLQVEAGNDDIPVVVHSELRVVSDSGNVIAESFTRYQGLEPAKNRFKHIALCNTVTGCTALINESLAARALPVPEAAVMHDWWLALVASAFGKVVFIDQPLVEYRQHGSNTLGAREYRVVKRTLWELLLKILRMKPDPLLDSLALQADAFAARYGDRLSIGHRSRLRLASVMRIRWGAGQRTIFRLARKF
jgi:glycosyltransferase involved in cell wall biosynthesis